MKTAGRSRTDFMLSREVREAAAACGKPSDVAAGKAMRGAATRRLIRAEQYRLVMEMNRPHQASPSADGETPPRPGQHGDEAKSATTDGASQMDMKQYAGDTYLKVEDVRESGPVRATITAVEDGVFDKPVAILSSGESIQLNVSTVRLLIRSWGPNSTDWVDREMELAVGQVSYKEKLVDTIIVRPISAAIPLSEREPPPPPVGPSESEIDDLIPFN